MFSAELLDAVSGCFQAMAVGGYGLPFALFLAGLVGGFTHCVAMCGPFVMSQAGRVEKLSQSVSLPYHLGRITTYVVMASLLSSVLNLAFLYLPVRSFIVAPILMTAGLIFLINAFPALGRVFPWAVHIRLSVPYRFLSSGFERLSNNAGMMKKYLMGILLGFMPCGLIVSALMAAASAPSIFEAALSMSAFGLGTMPALVLVTFGGQALQVRFPVAMRRVTQGFMVWSSLWLFVLAGLLLI